MWGSRSGQDRRTDIVQISETTCLWYGPFRTRTIRVILAPDTYPRILNGGVQGTAAAHQDRFRAAARPVPPQQQELTVGLGLSYGQMSAMYAEMVLVSVRHSGVAIGYALGAILGGAFAPAIAQALVQRAEPVRGLGGESTRPRFDADGRGCVHFTGSRVEEVVAVPGLPYA